MASDAPAPDTVDAPPKKKRGLLLALCALLPMLGGAYIGVQQYAPIAAAAEVFRTASAESEGEATEYGQFHEVDQLIVNPADSGGQRYLMVSLGLETHDAKVIAALETHEIVVRDVVLRYLSDQTIERLTDVGWRDELKETLRAHISDVLPEGEVERLYFTKYVLQ